MEPVALPRGFLEKMTVIWRLDLSGCITDLRRIERGSRSSLESLSSASYTKSSSSISDSTGAALTPPEEPAPILGAGAGTGPDPDPDPGPIFRPGAGLDDARATEAAAGGLLAPVAWVAGVGLWVLLVEGEGGVGTGLDLTGEGPD